MIECPLAEFWSSSSACPIVAERLVAKKFYPIARVSIIFACNLSISISLSSTVSVFRKSMIFKVFRTLVFLSKTRKYSQPGYFLVTLGHQKKQCFREIIIEGAAVQIFSSTKHIWQLSLLDSCHLILWNLLRYVMYTT